jgi:hypothetical protein
MKRNFNKTGEVKHLSDLQLINKESLVSYAILLERDRQAYNTLISEEEHWTDFTTVFWDMIRPVQCCRPKKPDAGFLSTSAAGPARPSQNV